MVSCLHVGVWEMLLIVKIHLGASSAPNVVLLNLVWGVGSKLMVLCDMDSSYFNTIDWMSVAI